MQTINIIAGEQHQLSSQHGNTAVKLIKVMEKSTQQVFNKRLSICPIQMTHNQIINRCKDHETCCLVKQRPLVYTVLSISC